MIEADRLSKVFEVRRKTGRLARQRERVVAVKSVSFSVAAGEAVGYVGPNGSGKSTTIKMLTGILVPSGGRATVCGLDPVARRPELAMRTGTVFGQRSQLWWDLPLGESFTLLRAIYRVPHSVHAERLAECVEVLGLASLLGRPVRQLSLGQRMRGEVTAALLHDPQLLVLDEPTIGLDLESKEKLRALLTGLGQRMKTTLLLTTHDLDDIEQLCSRIIVIDHGSILADGPLDQLRQEVSPERTLLVDLEVPSAPVTGLPGVTRVEVEAEGRRHSLTFRRAETTAARLIADVAGRLPVSDVSVLEPSIDDVIRRLYSGARPRSLEHVSRRCER